MKSDREQIIETRCQIKLEFAETYSLMSSLLFDIDPMDINFGDNTDEYEPEVDTILPRVMNLNTSEDIELVVREEFGKWFGNDFIEGISDEIFAEISEGILKIKMAN